ncbi:storkhead-box protein 2-like isoform X2 [Hypomesus transpacificus]|uniref:storkhead-box protein 2-like isoform X2 n=1 Tax=Hypomesus transpacificus TaxID=137520 RepID=UPI001F073B14|nr:storkhead-box protein 2-like isoform X2 [Hypomesus transpacificus]
MKKTRSTTLRRAWPSSDFSDRASERTRSRSEKDYRLHKHKHYPPQYLCQSPPGYITPGDVSPISMSPISQSQFIPLGEVLCLAISAMNSAHKPVTQEALTEHLATCFPGVPTPTAEVLHHTLSMLVRERKIYPTAEGYFIVTPQTYFITPSLIRTSSKWYHLDERGAERQTQQQQQQQHQQQQTQCTSPLSGTITPSTSGGVRDRPHPKAHGDSYNSYRDDPPSHHTTLQRRSPKDHREAYPSPHSPHSPPTPAPAVPTEKSRSTLSFPFKSDTLTKHRDREGGGSGGGGDAKQARKFGLKLFRLSFKKDKTKQLATFSAQFPPEEWPLRDEDTPSTVPRDVEMEIIRRINPDLTVENVARHTAVMKRLEEERVQRSKASSAQHSARSRRSRGHRKPQAKPSRSHSKTRASRGEPSEGSNLDLAERDYRHYSSSLARSPREHAFSVERSRHRHHLAHSNPNILDAAHLPVTPEWDVSGELAKRRTEMPFPEPSHGPSHSKVHRSHSHTQERKSRTERSDSKAKERSRSMDNSKGPLGQGLMGPPEYYERSLEERGRYYTDDGTLRASAQAAHYARATPPAAKLAGDDGGGRSLEKSKSRDSLPAYGEMKAYSPKPPPASSSAAASQDDYFHCSASSEAVLTVPSPLGTLGKPGHDSLGGGKLGGGDRQTPHPPEYKEEAKGQNGGLGVLAGPGAEPLSNGRGPPHHPSGSGSIDKRKEIFSKDTLFKPPPNALPGGYGEASYSSKPGPLRSTPVLSSAEVLDNQEGFDPPGPLLALSGPPSSGPPGLEPGAPGGAEASFDYYNVSDDDELEDAAAKRVGPEEKAAEGGGGGGGGGGVGGGGTMQWLLEREKERDLQRRFERNLTFPCPKENDPGQSQQSAHSARLDSMDSSSVTVDSGFNSPRTRESLASNTSSIVESNRRQNLALSPGHLGIATGNGPPFTFRTIPEPPSSQPEKLQKPPNCLASITSV